MDKIELVLQQSQEAFQTEISRNDLLTSKAEKYLAAVGLLISMGLVDVAGPGDQQSLSQVGAPAWLHLSALVAFALSFAATLLTLRTREYVSHPRGTGLVDSLKSRDIDDRGAQVRVAKMYLLARETNALINDQRSRLLSLGGVTLAPGFVLAAAARLARSL